MKLVDVPKLSEIVTVHHLNPRRPARMCIKEWSVFFVFFPGEGIKLGVEFVARDGRINLHPTKKITRRICRVESGYVMCFALQGWTWTPYLYDQREQAVSKLSTSSQKTWASDNDNSVPPLSSTSFLFFGFTREDNDGGTSAHQIRERRSIPSMAPLSRSRTLLWDLC